MKILWSSVAPWIGTGYGQQTRLFTPRIRDLGHHVALSAYAGIEGTISSWNDMTVYPADLTRVNKYNLKKYVEKIGKKILNYLRQVWLTMSLRHFHRPISLMVMPIHSKIKGLPWYQN